MCHKAPKKHHTLPADVLPNANEALLKIRYSPTLVLNDKVTQRQFARFLQNAKFPDAWVRKVKLLKDVFHMSLINQDQLFADWKIQ